MNHKYKIDARMLCHDVRLNTYISTVAEANDEPTEEEVWRLLNPAAEEILARYSGEGCQYELHEIKVEKL